MGRTWENDEWSYAQFMLWESSVRQAIRGNDHNRNHWLSRANQYVWR